MIPYGRQEIVQQDIDAVINILKSDFLTQGPAVPQFEKAVAHTVHAKHAIAVNSGTSALHVACRALDLGPGQKLWTSPITFLASANCGLYCGASVDFVDIDPRTYNMSPRVLERKLCNAEKSGNLPDIVVPVHLCGQSCEMEAIHELSKSYGFRIIEDACHAVGGKYKGETIGCCRYSDITVFSFHPVKIITTAEGGMALTNDDILAEKMELLRSHGITRNPERMTHAPDGPWYYQQIDLGFNYRMTDLQAALGLSQLTRLEEYVKRRNHLALRYNQLLEAIPVTIPWQHGDCYSPYHLYVIRLKVHKIGKSHKEVFESMRQQGIGVNLHYIPVHTQPWYQKMGFAKGDFMEAEKYYSEAITLPIYPTMTEQQQDTVIEALKNAVI
jgi:UDP-4-amino-4,6-dideoxy-N-acetyl-beta-L-altrosamine transaminase